MTYVRTHTGEKVLCVWDDCQRPGRDEIKVKLQHEDLQWWDYIFCSEFHKALFTNGHVSYSRVAVGSKGGLL